MWEHSPLQNFVASSNLNQWLWYAVIRVPPPQVSTLLGRIPSAVGYQPTLATDMGTMQERITTTKKGSITSVQAVFVPADDLTDPAPATTFAHLDTTTVLSRAISGGWVQVCGGGAHLCVVFVCVCVRGIIYF